ncbi:MAG: hypothetical protein WCD70_10340, partial [Alphaproteobacteria bacterium]
MSQTAEEKSNAPLRPLSSSIRGINSDQDRMLGLMKVIRGMLVACSNEYVQIGQTRNLDVKPEHARAIFNRDILYPLERVEEALKACPMDIEQISQKWTDTAVNISSHFFPHSSSPKAPDSLRMRDVENPYFQRLTPYMGDFVYCLTCIRETAGMPVRRTEAPQ